MTKTTNYQLPKWEKTDRIQMKDFNDMTATLDAAIPQFTTGTYTGTGQSGQSGKRTLDLGFRPKLVFIAAEDAWSFPSGAVFVSPAQFAFTDNYKLNAIWSDTGLSWWSVDNAASMLNAQDVTYRYLAIH